MKNLIREQPILFSIITLFWLKTLFVGLIDFNIRMENPLQLLIFIISPLPFLLVVLGLIFTCKPWKQFLFTIMLMVITTVILYGNGIYYREFSDYITIPLLLMGNVSDLGSSIFALINWYDFLYILDVPIVLYLLILGLRKKTVFKKHTFGQLRPYFIFVAVIFVLNLGLANIERPLLLTRSFDRALLVKNIGIYHFHVYDATLHANTRAQRVFASEEELAEINGYLEKNIGDATEDLFGIGEGKNVILISAESVQNFVIGNTVNGEEITPFLNELIEDSFYFTEFYHQTAQGKTSDSEFLINNSLFPLARGAVFFTHASNEYYSLPEILGEHHYYTAVLHANNGSFWNRDAMYKQMGYDRFYTEDDYSINKENSIGWGLKDIEFMEQSIEHMVQMPQPFHVKLITLTNHFPFELGEKDKFIKPFDSNSKTLNNYFPAVRYTDEAIKIFFDRLKEEDLYDDSIIVIYGDHYGISSFHNRAMGTYLGKEVTPFIEVQLQQVPLIIHIPGLSGEKNDTVGGQIDLRPTLLHLLGIKAENQVVFGNNLFSQDREDLVILRNGSFITKDYIYTDDLCYSKDEEMKVEKMMCEPYFDEVKNQLEYSDRIIYGDLLRFNDFQKNE
ncbi:LTA synthase family protein [Evansella tamaricis]|uniref:LTA synthase family protein n=1 Tax=Evansella tamaricis TaxID=2069301 RepID=A0ABS6JDI1_9BACI|nr:LTA synthase family protein [Evansella tamaricis]MBU9711733.1 LTA synthase family protein [Evansella tamaricis]